MAIEDEIDRAIAELLRLRKQKYAGIDIRVREDGVDSYVWAKEESLPENNDNTHPWYFNGTGSTHRIRVDASQAKAELDALMESLKQIEEMLEKLKKLDAEQPETLPFSTYRVSWPGGYIENPWWTWFNTSSDNLRINYLW